MKTLNAASTLAFALAALTVGPMAAQAEVLASGQTAKVRAGNSTVRGGYTAHAEVLRCDGPVVEQTCSTLLGLTWCFPKSPCGTERGVERVLQLEAGTDAFVKMFGARRTVTTQVRVTHTDGALTHRTQVHALGQQLISSSALYAPVLSEASYTKSKTFDLAGTQIEVQGEASIIVVDVTAGSEVDGTIGGLAMPSTVIEVDASTEGGACGGGVTGHVGALDLGMLAQFQLHPDHYTLNVTTEHTTLDGALAIRGGACGDDLTLIDRTGQAGEQTVLTAAGAW